MRPPNWSAAEIDALEDAAVNNPPDLMVRSYNTWATRNGYIKRSHQAILSRLSRSGGSVRAVGEWVSSGLICDVLGVAHDTPQRWADHGLIPVHRDTRARRYFLRSDLRRLARSRPAAFGGISADRLFLLLEDRDLADSIAATHTRRAMEPKAVRAIETGWHYPSIRAAAERVHISRQAIQHAIRTGGTAADLHWTYA